jgi:hypothetical protein
MLLTTIFTTLSLSGVPAPGDIAPDFSEQLDYVDVIVSDADAMVVAYDHNGAVIGSFGLWVDDDGITWLAADFADGYALIGVSPEFEKEVYREEELPAGQLAERAELLLMYLDDPAQPAAKHSWGECGWKAVAAGVACGTARPIACVWGGIKASCACVPKLVKEFEQYECPWDL